ncbi:non-ribosomal peptide synthetase [Egbenema bharatensis]|uniref:non-ribosomal peptide synthetase n=1 Tax=Egbenema bharatensis TaxID=3463334 RepID=UPI003A8A1E17
MDDVSQQLATLSPEQRAWLELRLKRKGLELPKAQIIPKRKDSNALPLSFAQQRLWFIQQLDPQNASYNIPVALRLQGHLRVAVLQQTFHELVSRHETLRTRIMTDEQGQPVQVIDPVHPIQVIMPIVDLSQISQPDLEIQRLATKSAQHPFDLAQPLLRSTLLHLSETDHVLLLTMHHIISDRWSLSVLMRELKVLYEAFSKGENSPLPDLPIQYADWAIWQRQSLQGEVLQQQLDYWKQQLAGLPVLEFPTDRPRPAIPTFQGKQCSFILSRSLTTALKQLSAQEGVTLFVVFLTAFNILLCKYSNQDDIVVGTDIANRNRVETEGLIGLLVNTLVLRMKLSGNPTFRELLQRVREVTLGAYAHQDLPFERLVEFLNPERALGQMAPLFQVKLDFQLAPIDSLELSDLTLSIVPTESETTKFELRFNLAETEQGIHGQVEYSTDLFDESKITCLVTHFHNILEAIASCPEQNLSEFSVLSETEWQQILVEWNQTQIEYSQNQCIHQLFEAQVERTPDSIALAFEGQQFSYQELNHRANQLAHHLQFLGVEPDTLVGVCLERSPALMIALLAILKAGGAYVPLDPSYPQARLAFMLNDAQTSIVLTQAALVDTLSTPAHLFCLDTHWDTIATSSQTNPHSSVSPDHLSYVIYTSGSTGQPKGAMNMHQGVCNRLRWMQDAYHLTSADRVLQKTPFSFDVSVWEFFWPLMVGATLVIARPGGHQDSRYLMQLVAQERITTLHFVPSMLQVFLNESSLEFCNGSLKRILCSGEALPLSLQQQCLEQLEAELHNLYEPTEAAIDVTAWHCQPQENETIVPIGRPIANTQIYILNPAGQPVPIGVPGEVHIGGVQLARGYLRRPELTAEKFIPNPFSSEPGLRLYKTGDLAHYLPDGTIEYLGRIDHQVKIRGFRIELGEIEAVLNQHPIVSSSVVLVREDEPGLQRLVAYVVMRSNEIDLTLELRQFVAEKLPTYMVPTVFVKLEALPLTPNGKVDRKALPTPGIYQPELLANYVIPQTEQERTIAAIWKEILHLKNVGIHDNFFDLGGHSLLLIQLNNQLHERLKLNLSILDLFRYPTIHSLIKYLNQIDQEFSASQQEVVQQFETLQHGKARMKKRFERSQQKQDRA